jgi:hypothetical protein
MSNAISPEIFDKIFYYKNVILDPLSLINLIEKTDEKLSEKTSIPKWNEWTASGDDPYFFGYQKRFNHGIENNDLYFKQMTLLHPSLKRENAKLSGICHHMLFNRVYINEIIKMVEEYHSSTMDMPNSAPVSFWKLFIYH